MSRSSLYQITATELAVDRKIDKRPVAHPTFTVEEEANCPDLALLRGLLVPTRLPAFQAGRPTAPGSYFEVPHFSYPIATIGHRGNAQLRAKMGDQRDNCRGRMLKVSRLPDIEQCLSDQMPRWTSTGSVLIVQGEESIGPPRPMLQAAFRSLTGRTD